MALFLILLPVLPAEASCELSSARIDNVLLKVGDGERRVLERDPDRVVQLENDRGGAAGIRYDFYLRDKTVQVYVAAGRISRICHLND
jgi:ATP-dependent exoDNAse (exonuclease V) alpha subunit